MVLAQNLCDRTATRLACQDLLRRTAKELRQLTKSMIQPLTLWTLSCWLSLLWVWKTPDRSILWLFPRAILLLTKGFVDARFQHCKWTIRKPMRPKWVRIRANSESFKVLEGLCNAEHVHLGWGQTETGEFKTALDAE